MRVGGCRVGLGSARLQGTSVAFLALSQDLRRLAPVPHWLQRGGGLPHLGDRPDFGWMGISERSQNEYSLRRPLEKGDLPAEPHAFTE
eukprot:7620917-Pyramimonas_sp.AAC.1